MQKQTNKARSVQVSILRADGKASLILRRGELVKYRKFAGSKNRIIQGTEEEKLKAGLHFAKADLERMSAIREKERHKLGKSHFSQTRPLLEEYCKSISENCKKMQNTLEQVKKSKVFEEKFKTGMMHMHQFSSMGFLHSLWIFNAQNAVSLLEETDFSGEKGGKNLQSLDGLEKKLFGLIGESRKISEKISFGQGLDLYFSSDFRLKQSFSQNLSIALRCASSHLQQKETEGKFYASKLAGADRAIRWLEAAKKLIEKRLTQIEEK
ncbi:hypothetical protein COU37_00580 [Candidatus Micrarchaeota archaeon CG10_big_fil_rev_8_21_14_0_10_45_29]|nr:MAG: hypothetical protein COU37_00580 [Candidatus Micrarchaeota archaeon CG10_big_fil_rev_8_21_14_0_10_45_29]